MDNESLVDRVTKEVMETLSARNPAPSAGSCAVLNGGSCLECGQCASNCPDLVDRLIDGGACRISSHLGIGEVEARIAHMIDHTVLKADTTEEQIRQLCREAATYCFASVCVNPTWVELCARLLRRQGVKVCSVIGFPFGATTTETKTYETRNAIGNGATEIDMVINVGELKSKNYDKVRKDIGAVVRASHPGALVKVILETCYLTEEEKIKACELSRAVGADYVKTSTGFGPGGATVEDIALMRKVVGPEMGVKASGGVRTFETAREMIEAGATRIGASAGLKIIKAQ
jgi:deoxyribose-phosphate aldolase